MDNTRRKFLQGLGILGSSAFLNCDGKIFGPEEPDYPSLKPTDNLYFNKNNVAIGKFHLDSGDAFWLKEDPNCRVGGGGIGRAFDVFSPKYGIYMWWTFGLLQNIYVFNGWSGKVNETGIKLGDNRELFLSKYPLSLMFKDTNNQENNDFLRTPVDHKTATSNKCYLTAILNSDEKIMCLMLDDSTPDDFVHFRPWEFENF